MNVPAIARIATLVVVVTACGTGGPPTASPPPASSATSPPTASLPASPAAPTLEATVSPPTTSEPSSTTNPPPTGSIVADGETVDGWLGSYCWQGLCADVPQIPAMDDLPRIVPMPEERLTFALAGGATFNSWRASYWTAGNETPLTLGEGGEGFDPDAQPSAAAPALNEVEFVAPPGGDSSVHVQVFFPEGDLSYYWHAAVQRLPPSAELMSGGGHVVEALLGSWCYDDGCADKPAIPKDRLPKLRMQPDELLTFQLADRHQFASVTVMYGDEMDSADAVELAAATPDRPRRSFDFYPLPAGDWALWVSVGFPDDGGDALYAWHVIVEEDEGTDPPTATLSAGGDPVAGQPASYCYLDTCADGPWPQKGDLPELRVAGAASELTLTLAEPARFIGWTVAYGELSNDDESTNLDSGGSSDPDAAGPDYSEVTFDGPPTGDWVLFVWLQLRGGDLSYAWHVTVD